MTDKELCAKLRSWNWTGGEYVGPHEGDTDEAALRIEQLASAHAQVVAERDGALEVLSIVRVSETDARNLQAKAEQERDTLRRQLAERTCPTLGENCACSLASRHEWMEAHGRVRADLAAARQRIERFKQYVPLVHGPDYDWCYVCEEPMPDKHAPTCPWAERGAEGGTQS